jgi:hypothetical protein
MSLLRKRSQFSLLTLLLIVIASGAFLGLYLKQKEASKLRDEVRALREEVGYLDVDDPEKIWARVVKQKEIYHWRWRIYVPKDGLYTLYHTTDGIGPEDFPKHSNSKSMNLKRGEFKIEAEVAQTGESATLHMDYPGGVSTIGLGTAQKGYDDWNGSSTSRTLSEKSTAFEPGERVELLRLRAMKTISPTSKSTTAGPSPGLLIWIQEGPPKRSAP